MMIDSCSGVCACAPDFGLGLGTERSSHRTLEAAGGQAVRHHGVLRSLNHKLASGRIARIEHEVADVSHTML